MKRTETILDTIMIDVRKEMADAKAMRPVDELRRIMGDAAPVRSLKDALRKRFGIIAEIKERSPSHGPMRKKNVEEALAAYEQSGIVRAISVLTNDSHFGMSMERLRDVKARGTKPVLRKDFIFDEYQVYEARAYGADAVLLIVAALERRQLIDFHALAGELSLDVLIEIHHERELDTVLEWIPNARMIGINNRDLTTFTTDLTVTKRLAPRIPSDRLIVSESGIQNRGHVEQLLEMGVHAMLIGESLIRADDARTKIQELRGVRSAAQA